MVCRRCRKSIAAGAARCPHCGENNPAGAGVFQTSTVLISAAGEDRVYRSVDDVPAELRHRLLESTNGANSATILIADRKGRREIERAMKNLPGSAQRRLSQAIAHPGDTAAVLRRLTPRRRKLIAAVVLLLALLVIAAIFLHQWTNSRWFSSEIAPANPMRPAPSMAIAAGTHVPHPGPA